ncbi:MAG: hypothetical protein ABI948_05080 [Thermoleophilia bacterium]
MRRVAPALSVAVLLAGCGSSSRTAPSVAARGPANLIRIALPGYRWPLDPASVSGRDELTLARALFATPLTTDSRTGELRPGLCTRWASTDGGRTWRFRCTHARAVAAELERMRRLPRAPAGWLFVPIAGLDRSGSTVTLRLRFPWLRFPYALTVPAAAPPGIAGPFKVESASPQRLIARRGHVRLVFSRLVTVDAVRAWREGDIDEAPIPLGDLGRLRLDASVARSVRVRPLLGVDVVAFDLRTGPLANLTHTRRVYWETANRADYAQLVAGGAAAPAFSLVGSASAPGTAEFRRARSAIASLPPVSVPIATPADLELQYAADTLVADWRELGLGAHVAAHSMGARFERLVAAYPQDEALAAALLLPHGGPARALLLHALAQRNPAAVLARVDAALRAESAVVPIAGVASARLVSRRLRGWRQDTLGVVDYRSVRALAGSPSR